VKATDQHRWQDHRGVVRLVPRRQERLRLSVHRGRANDLALRAFVFVRDRFTCQGCGRAVASPPCDYDGRGSFFVEPASPSSGFHDELQVDHIVRWSVGGHHPDNLQALCQRCNTTKAKGGGTWPG
jgi:5-methylcytosine-specific restriction endonuclease McrA